MKSFFLRCYDIIEYLYINETISGYNMRPNIFNYVKNANNFNMIIGE